MTPPHVVFIAFIVEFLLYAGAVLWLAVRLERAGIRVSFLLLGMPDYIVERYFVAPEETRQANQKLYKLTRLSFYASVALFLLFATLELLWS